MHILLVHQYFLEKNGGGGSRFNELARIWSERGHKVTVISGMVHYNTGKKAEKYKGKFIYKEDYDENVTVYRCHVSESYNASFIGRLWGYFSFVFSSVVCGLFRTRDKYDCIIVTSPPLFVGITGLILSAIKRVKFVFEIRDLWPESAIDTGVLTSKPLIKMAYFFEKLIYKKSKCINVLTPAFRDTLIQKKKVPSDKVFMIPNAADFSIVESLKDFNVDKFREENRFNGKFVATYVGAHGVANHLIQILETAELMKDDDVLFLLIGAGMEKENLKKFAEEKELNNVRFVDPVPKKDVFKYILASDAGMSVLKKCDTFKTIYSNKTFDYMSCKKPVLLAIDGVSRELVEKAECGLFIEPENIQMFAEQVKYYMSNPEKVAGDGLNGYKYAKENFDREKLGEEYLQNLEKHLMR